MDEPDPHAPPHWWEKDIVPGVLLVAATLISFALQNTGARSGFDALLHQPIGAVIGTFHLSMDVAHFIADGLMAVFFLYVGLELKRECIEGPFSNPREAALPLIGALGGMIAPALIYLAIATPFDASYARGWAIPAATDIAFALGVLALLGSRIPKELRLFLLALAIADDLGAILVIALFYSDDISGFALGGAIVTFLSMLLLNFLGMRRLTAYWILGAVLWAFMLASGVHATIAGVLAALAFPMRAPDGRSPLVAAEHELKPWVLLGVMPIFALANAGAPLAEANASTLLHPITLAVAGGLFFGKPIGIFGAVMVGAMMLRQPIPMRRMHLLGLAMIAGVGFTMSLFIGALAFGEGPLTVSLRVGVLVGSSLSALVGYLLLSRARQG